MEIQQKTTYQFSTSSQTTSRAMEVIATDQKCRELVLLFAKIKSRKRRNVLMKMAHYLINNSQHH